MANHYSFDEQTDMLLVLGFCNRNCRQSVRVYHERYPNRRRPCRKTFANVERRLRERGSLQRTNKLAGRPRNVRNPEVEEDILQMVEDDPRTSSRVISRQLGVSKSTVNRTTREQLLIPFHLTPVQDILLTDFGTRLEFCHIMRQRNNDEDLNFSSKILFTDEKCFTRRGVTNVHNEHNYAQENPHVVKIKHFQHEFSINVWMGIVNNHLVGPFRLPHRLNGNSYLEFLQEQLPGLLEDIPLVLRQKMWLMHDGAPPHFTRNVRDHLHLQYPRKWIGRGADAPIKWPPRSPDLTPCDFFLWGALSAKVYSERINTEEQLWNRIVNAANTLLEEERGTLQRVQFNFLKRVNLCIAEDGGHFEQLL